MGDVLFANSASSVLAITINNSVTSIQVQATEGALFPSPSGSQFFMLTLEDEDGNLEVVQCTSRSTDVLTVVRGQESTAALAFTADITRCELRITKLQLEGFLQNTGDINVGGDITLSGTVDTRDVATDGTKLDNIETNAKDDQTAGEIEAIVSHDNLLAFVLQEHIRWDLTGAESIHADRIPSTYTHPSHPGDDFSVDTGLLGGAVIVSDIDINITTDLEGHVTDANGAIATRTLTLANLGYTGSATANDYTHPAHPGDDFSIDTGLLGGAVIVSDVDINVTTDTQGHVTDANATIATRTLTLANLGYTGSPTANDYTHPTHTSRSINTSGAVVLDLFASNTLGHVTNITTRTMTLANLGYTGSPTANDYTHPGHPGDDFSIDTGLLGGAVVVSDVDINITTDAQGHVTDANATIATRTMTAAQLSAVGLTGAQTIAGLKTFSTRPKFTGQSVFLYHASEASGRITFGTAAPSGGADGDIHFQYA